MTKRKFLPYELNWLNKYHFNLGDLDSIGETPVEYITGHGQFCEHDFLVNQHTLIPRIETEEILPLAINFLRSLQQQHLTIADVGTGSGCIGISLAVLLYQKHYSDFEIHLSDVSSQALQIAQQNSLNLLGENNQKLQFIHSNLLDNYPDQTKYDLIIGNLPYIPTREISSLDSSVKDFEPFTALDGGPDGSQIINKLLGSISSFLKTQFLVILEIDSTHTLSSFSIPSRTQANIILDSLGKNRFLVLTPN